MEIRKLLVVPCDTLIAGEEASSFASFLSKTVRALAIRLGRSGYTYDAEIQFYGDLPKVLGRKNVFTYGRFHPHLHVKAVPGLAPYPSCHGLPEGTAIRAKDVDRVLREVDAVFISIRAGERAAEVMAKAGERGIPRALLDFEDHPELYGVADARRNLTRNFRPTKDFEVYFKKELPLGFKTDIILPLAPSPVRPESYRFSVAAKRFDIFYSGRARPGCQADRDETLLRIRQFPRTLILDHASHGTFLSTAEYWRSLAESRLALSPSGKSWDSFRHCEVGLAPSTVLIAPRPYLETAGSPLVDGLNSILYDTEFRGGKYHLARGGEFVDKVRRLLGRPADLERLADAWKRDVLSGHTVFARSRQIIDMMQAAIWR